MDLPTFLTRLDRAGGDLEAWPPAARADAQALLVASVPARAALAAMVEVERLLRATPSPAAMRPPGLDVLAATAMRHLQDRAALRLARPAARAVFAAAVLVTLCLGVVLGREPTQQGDGPDRVLASAFETTGTVDVD